MTVIIVDNETVTVMNKDGHRILLLWHYLHAWLSMQASVCLCVCVCVCVWLWFGHGYAYV